MGTCLGFVFVVTWLGLNLGFVWVGYFGWILGLYRGVYCLILGVVDCAYLVLSLGFLEIELFVCGLPLFGCVC